MKVLHFDNNDPADFKYGNYLTLLTLCGKRLGFPARPAAQEVTIASNHYDNIDYPEFTRCQKCVDIIILQKLGAMVL